MTLFDYISIILLIIFAIVTWVAARRLGIGGLVFVQIALFIGYFALAGVAMGQLKGTAPFSFPHPDDSRERK